ncbi:molybdenum ABC transporter ATP-binding protein [Aestuariibacter halophilus]|uniref:Molybdenum ABC transporter ATP-binding protein n=1 Tax=Fluctibacter halophilus TaxID=226011 RepID=A0ABS8G4C2_9ALTE|nr:molybdenum ABC transporter ATP-binding protein [Aestuariibacter halophilus]MCC2615349.1 molybdenum ABC transporter ATP-binding protein [Aestuariibacter halophilus]
MIRIKGHLQRKSWSLDIDCTLPVEGVTGIMGPSGAGKSTILRVIAGLEGHHSVSVRFNEHLWQADDAWTPTEQRRVGWVSQHPHLFPHLDVAGNLAFAQRRATPHSGNDIDADEVIALLDIGPLMDKSVAELSGGQAQRVSMARALFSSPQVLLLDEPLSGQDPGRKEQILPYLQRLKRRDWMPIVYVSHDGDDMARLADHLVYLEEGRVCQQGSVAEMFADVSGTLVRHHRAMTVVEGQVSSVNAAHHSVVLDTPVGALIWVGEAVKGTCMRVCIAARDVSISRQPLRDSSIQNCLPAMIKAITQEPAGWVWLALECNGATLLAQVSVRAFHRLELGVGDPVYALLKGLAVLAD